MGKLRCKLCGYVGEIQSFRNGYINHVKAALCMGIGGEMKYKHACPQCGNEKLEVTWR